MSNIGSISVPITCCVLTYSYVFLTNGIYPRSIFLGKTRLEFFPRCTHKEFSRTIKSISICTFSISWLLVIDRNCDTFSHILKLILSLLYSILNGVVLLRSIRLPIKKDRRLRIHKLITIPIFWSLQSCQYVIQRNQKNDTIS